jgi:hypothetical protein
MAAAWNLDLAFGSIAITDESLNLGVLNLVWWQIIHIFTHYVLNVVSMWTIKNIAAVWIYNIKCEKFSSEKDTDFI